MQYRKKHLHPLVLLLFFGVSLSGQTFKAALVGGFNFSQLDGDLLIGFHQPGFYAGGQVFTPLNNRWDITTGLAFSQEGARRTLNDNPNAIFDKIRMNYVEIPLFLCFNEWKFKLYTGPVYGRLINYKVIDYLGIDITNLQNWRNNQLSGAMGITFIPSGKWGFDFRWHKSITNIRKDPGAAGMLGRSISFRMFYFI
jgi:hypothetical protein